VETHTMITEEQDGNAKVGDKNNALSSDVRNEVRYFWDGGLLANTPLRQTILAHRYYWQRVRKVEGDLPILRFGIINLHPLKQEYLPSDYDAVVDRKNDIIYHDRTEFDENVAVIISDLITLAQALLKLAEESGASKEAIRKILNEKSKGVGFDTRKQLRFEDLLKGKIDVDFVARLERKNDSHTISNKIFDFTKNTILQLIQDGYEETKDQMKKVFENQTKEFS
jgi:NTE family protein